MIGEPLLEEECEQHEWGESCQIGKSKQEVRGVVEAHI